MNFRLRISKCKRKVVDKGYTPNWTEEIFEIDKVLLTKPVTHKIVDLIQCRHRIPLQDNFDR